jgi:hypothetical protein
MYKTIDKVRYVVDKAMKIQVMTALLLLLIVCGQQAFCCQHAIKIEKVIEEKKIEHISAKNLIH